MSTKVFVSFRFKDEEDLKKELDELFDSSNKIINRLEDEDRSEMSEETIRDYLYSKLKETSVTIIILTPKAIEYDKDILGRYDDWLYDELRYSLEDRKENRTNGAIALYTDESKNTLFEEVYYECDRCQKTHRVKEIKNFNNLVRMNMLNIKDDYKYNQCEGFYDSDKDSYISLIVFDEFKKDPNKYIDKAKDKRDRKEEFSIIKRMPDH